ncbi:hypothetical protein HN51_039603 [Arachis hypogaea]
MAYATQDWSSNGNNNPWPFRIKLTRDCMKSDSIKIPPSKEFEANILGEMNESSRQALESWRPVKIVIYDVDICKTYDTKLCKKESFWFEPIRALGEKPHVGATMTDLPSYDAVKARQDFVYSIHPFKHIISKRNLNYGQQIGLRVSHDQAVVTFDFSVINSSS